MKIKLLLCLWLSSAVTLASVAPSFRGELLGGGRVSLKSALKPNRALLLCFWATWCPPCLAELKQVADGIIVNPDLPLEVLTVNVDAADTSADVKSTMKLYGFNYRVVLDPKQEVFTKYQNVRSLPFSVLLDPSGKIMKRYSSYDEGMFSDIKSAVISQFKGKK